MKTYLLDILNKYNRLSESLDVKTVLCNKSWLVFNDTGDKELYIFQENGSLFASVNGNVTNATWQYVAANKSIIISFKELSLMFHPSFIDKNIFALQQDGTKKYIFMIDEAQCKFFNPKSLSDLNSYFDGIELKKREEERKNREYLLAQQREEELKREKKLYLEQEKKKEEERKLKEWLAFVKAKEEKERKKQEEWEEYKKRRDKEDIDRIERYRIEREEREREEAKIKKEEEERRNKKKNRQRELKEKAIDIEEQLNQGREARDLAKQISLRVEHLQTKQEVKFKVHWACPNYTYKEVTLIINNGEDVLLYEHLYLSGSQIVELKKIESTVRVTLRLNWFDIHVYKILIIDNNESI